MNDKYEMMIPPMLSGDKLIEALKCLPEYDPSIREADMMKRLSSLTDIYRVYYPFPMSVEIYNKLYISTVLSLKKKNTKTAVKQHNITYKAMVSDRLYHGIIGGADSLSIIGKSGSGKTSSIQRALKLISGGEIIETDNPYCKIIPCLQVQCPYDASPKGLLLEILRNVDAAIDTKYYERSRKRSDTTDILIGTVSQVALNHIGLLVIDEIQNVYGRKNGTSLMAMIIQLINSSGISIVMVGTEECIPFFENALQLARRAQGLRYNALSFDSYFEDFCKTVWEYQYTVKYTAIDAGILAWLYEHSGGIISSIVSLMYEAQEIAIMGGHEALDLHTLNSAYKNRMSFMQRFVDANTDRRHTGISRKGNIPVKNVVEKEQVTDYQRMDELIGIAKNRGVDIIDFLKENILVEEVNCG